MRFLLGCCCALVIWAQAPPEIDPSLQIAAAELPVKELARQWIKDPRPVYRAWAAQIIRQHEWEGLFTAEMIDGLGDLSHLDATSETSEDRMLRMVMLDALIQGHVNVARSVSQALLIRYPAQALILLYERGCPGVLVDTQILDGAKSEEAWLVAAQCLVGEKGGPIELLQRLRIAAEVKVFDPNVTEGGGFGIPGGTGLAGVGGGFAPPPFPWPRSFDYTLSMRGNTLLRGDRYPVYYTRGSTSSGLATHGDRNEYTLQILRDKFGAARGPQPLLPHPSLELHWTGLDQYRSDLQAFVADQQSRYAELVSLLVRSRALTPEERERSRLQLDIEVHNGRSYQTQPIPNVGLGEHDLP